MLAMKIASVLEALEPVLPQGSLVDEHNLWIVKPSFNARGLGVFGAQIDDEMAGVLSITVVATGFSGQ